MPLLNRITVDVDERLITPVGEVDLNAAPVVSLILWGF
jgi:hypothetical protein